VLLLYLLFRRINELRSFILLIIHPVIQIIAIFISLSVLHRGIQRAEQNHFGIEKKFNWKRHVLMGRIAFIILFAGISTGLIITRLNWKSFLITGFHGYTGLLVLFLILTGIFSGTILNSQKEHYGKLNVFHGINNTVLILLLLFQIYTGFKVYITYVLSYY
jgi:uncharacterized membrane protein YozB (DUF420 family)